MQNKLHKVSHFFLHIFRDFTVSGAYCLYWLLFEFFSSDFIILIFYIRSQSTVHHLRCLEECKKFVIEGGLEISGCYWTDFLI